MTTALTETALGGQYAGRQWTAGDGEEFSSVNPATAQTLWTGRAATPGQVDRAVAAARGAFEKWAALRPEDRIAFLNAFADQLRARKESLAATIARETGKPMWESLEEVGSMIAKVAVSISAFHERRTSSESATGDVMARTRFKPMGVTAVLGPFNFPGHLPNGHIVPALLAGNTVVFKPSELAPLTAQQTIELWQAAGLPAGVINLVQGGRDTGGALAAHADIDGLFFTGSFLAGQALHRLFAGQPQKILALEMGGNNPLIIWDAADLNAAAIITLQSAYITSGQRCSCARRLIISRNTDGERFITHLASMLPAIRVGAFTDRPEPFMGPVISAAAADRLLAAQDDLRQWGGNVLVEMRRPASDSSNRASAGAFLTPGLIDVTEVQNRPDVEWFGPLLQIIRVDDFDAAVKEANATAYGLSAALLSDRADLFELFYARSRAGVINWNRPTTGASGKLPFGGTGCSGNHRPSGYYAADYCSYPVASMETVRLTTPAKLQPGLVEPTA